MDLEDLLARSKSCTKQFVNKIEKEIQMFVSTYKAGMTCVGQVITILGEYDLHCCTLMNFNNDCELLSTLNLRAYD